MSTKNGLLKVISVAIITSRMMPCTCVSTDLQKYGILKVISVAFSSVFAYQVKEATEFLLNLLEDYLLQPFFLLLVRRTLVRRLPHLPDLLLRPCVTNIVCD